MRDQQRCWRELREAMQSLTEDQRQVLSYRFGLDMSHREIAQIMNRNEPAIRALQFRAVAALRRAMAEDAR